MTAEKLLDLICSEADIMAVFMYDKDGIPIVQAHSDDCPSQLLDSWLNLTFQISSEQISKLTGKCKHIITKYQSFSIVQFNRFPVFLTIIGSDQASPGYLVTIGEQLEETVQQIKEVLMESQS